MKADAYLAKSSGSVSAAPPSMLLKQFGKAIANCKSGPILDVGCGSGRNALFLESLGASVICIDKDPIALDRLEAAKRTPRLKTVLLDAVKDRWPFPPRSVEAIINVHFFHPRLIGRFSGSLRSGGLLLIETVGAHGGNYLELPPAGFFRSKLTRAFDIHYFIETSVGPLCCGAATTRLFASKS